MTTVFVAGTAWLLQFIEDLQQSREFHKTCELKLPNEAATIPEVLLFLSIPRYRYRYTDVLSLQATPLYLYPTDTP